MGKKYTIKHLHGYGLWACNLNTGKYIAVTKHRTISQLGRCWPENCKFFENSSVLGDCQQMERCDNSFVASRAKPLIIINGAAIYGSVRFPVKLARFVRS